MQLSRYSQSVSTIHKCVKWLIFQAFEASEILGQLKSQNNEQITPLFAQSDSTNIITMFKSLGSTGSTLMVDARKAKVKTAFLVKINEQKSERSQFGSWFT